MGEVNPVLLVISFLIVLGPLIMLHELGHFLMAKRGGIRALEFGMGYPPRARKLWRGKGYVVIDGVRYETPRNFELPWDWLIYPNKAVTLTYDELNGKAVARSIELAPDVEAALLQPPPAENQPALTAQVDHQAVAVAPPSTPRSAPPPAPKKRNITMQRGAHELSGIVDDLDPGTEYSLNWLPIGGFVRMWGEEGAVGKGSFNDAPKRWRAATLLAGPGMNLLIALVVFTLTYMLGYPSIPALVSQVTPNSIAATAGLQSGDVIVSIDRKPLRSSDDVELYAHAHQGQAIPLKVLRNGQAVQVELPAVVINSTDHALSGVQLESSINVAIQGVAKSSPAEMAKLQPDDLILAVDGQTITRPNQLQEYIKTHVGQAVTLLIQRGSQKTEVALTPRTPDQIPPGQGAIGIELSYLNNYKLVNYPLTQAVANALDDINATVQQIVTLPMRLLARQIAPSDAQVVGPVGISQYAEAAVKQTVQTGEPFWFLNLFAAISLALAITNLLPLPALDGGRLIFVILEAVRHKRISPEREAVVHFVGMMVLLALMVLITIQDISRLAN